MVLPKEYEEQLVKEALNQANSPNDSDFVEQQKAQGDNQTKIYLPEDPELRDKVLNAREDLKILRDYSIKNNLDKFQTDQLIQELLNNYQLTKEQVAGVYSSNQENLYKAFTNGFNTRLMELLQGAADYVPYVNLTDWNIEDYLDSEKEYRDTIKNAIATGFEKVGFVDPRFSPKTLGERVADKTAAGTLLGLEFSAGAGALSTSSKIAGSVPAAANILKQYGPDTFKNNVYDTTKRVIDDIIQLYQKSPGTAALTDVLATTGWEIGELPDELKEKDFEDYTKGDIAAKTLYPFISSLALPTLLYGFPVATYNAIQNVGDQGLLKILSNSFKNIFDKKAEASGVKAAKDEVQKSIENDYAQKMLGKSQKIEDLVAPVIESQNAKLAEKDLLKFEPTLAERTQDPQLIATQASMEKALPVRSDILTNRQERFLKNKAVLDATVAAEFPDSIPVMVKNADGTVEEILQPIKKFNQYVDPQKNINKAIQEDVPTKIAQAEEELLQTFPRIPDEVLKDAGIYLRGELGTRAKNKQDELYGELEQLVNQLNPNIIVNDFIDDVVTSLSLKPFQTTADLPFEYTALKDLTKPMDELLARIGPMFESGEISSMEFDQFVFALNKKLKKAAEKGDAPFGLAPQYDPETYKYTLTAAEVVGLKKSIQASLNKALRNPSTNSEKIRRLSLLQEKTNNLLKERPEGLGPEVTVEGRIPFGGQGREVTFPYSDAIENWLKKYNTEYLDPFEKGVILKLRTETGDGQYRLPNERVGAAFLESPETVDQFAKFFGDDPVAVDGLVNHFYDTMIRNVFKPSGIIDRVKLDKFKADNMDIINKIDSFVPNFKTDLNSKTDLGINLANRINEQTARLNIGGKIELDQLANNKKAFGGITYKNAEDMVSKAIKDPDDMDKIVTAIQQADPDGLMLQAFKKELFKKWSEPIRVNMRKGEYPNYGKMRSYLDTNEDSFQVFFNKVNDPEGLERLKLITDGYEMVGAVPFPVGSVNANEFMDGIKSIMGTDYPQILSRIFAVQSGRTGIKFVAGEVLARMFRQIGIRKRNEVLAEALYDRAFSESLTRMIVGQDIQPRDVEEIIGFLGRIGGMATDGIDYDIKELDVDSFENRKQKAIEETVSEAAPVVPPQPILNAPTISPASSLSQVSMAFLPPINNRNNASRGQQIFGATDTVFG